MNIEERVENLEREFVNLEKRLEPGMKLYNSLIPYGLDRYMLPLIRAFGKEYDAAQNGKKNNSIWNLKWARWAAIVAVIYGVLQVIVITLVLYNTLFGVHH